MENQTTWHTSEQGACRMRTNNMCPVCGYEMADGPRDYNICPSCGTEFGLHDENSSIEDLREVWFSSGPRWHSRVITQPGGWDPWSQFLRIRPQSAQGIASPQAFNNTYQSKSAKQHRARRKIWVHQVQPIFGRGLGAGIHG